ncbi:hypothetical protein ABLAC_05270 [Acinetobacter baumannii LAC-4]|nr:hypothetical protein [Acinetobacter baumannii]AIY35882.1 hypothetical protein ABLAC_05270 [Acinetobacter baumannii LAC-4]EKL39730.1 hypothetical protein ACIN5098_3199 [Acinetobacter baumannii OIFC098]
MTVISRLTNTPHTAFSLLWQMSRVISPSIDSEKVDWLENATLENKC